MSAPTRFRSIYDAVTIENILASVGGKIDSSVISNDWLGGTSRVASAQLALELYSSIQAFNNPNYLTQLITSIPNNNLFTNALLAKLNAISDQFLGSYASETARNLAVNTSNLVGNEISLIISGTNNLGEWQYWNRNFGIWQTLPFSDIGMTPQTVYTGVPIAAVVFPTSATSYTVEALISCFTTVDVQTKKILVTVFNGNAYYTTYSEVGTNLNLITISIQIGTSSLIIYASGPVGCTISAQRISNY